MDVTINTTAADAAAAVDAAPLTVGVKGLLKSAVAQANPPAGPLELSVATGDDAGWLVIRVAPYLELN